MLRHELDKLDYWINQYLRTFESKGRKLTFETSLISDTTSVLIEYPVYGNLLKILDEKLEKVIKDGVVRQHIFDTRVKLKPGITNQHVVIKSVNRVIAFHLEYFPADTLLAKRLLVTLFKSVEPYLNDLDCVKILYANITSDKDLHASHLFG